MSTEVLVALLGGGGFAAVIAAVITGLFTRRKLGAEATEIITKAAAGVVTNLTAEVARQEAARKEQAGVYEAQIAAHEAKLEEMAAAHVHEREEWRRVLQLHVAWDAIAIAKLSEVGVDLPETPPLLPASRYVDDDGHPIKRGPNA
jgi:hypothetical protein